MVKSKTEKNQFKQSKKKNESTQVNSTNLSSPNFGWFPKIHFFQNKKSKNKITAGKVKKADQERLQK